MNIKVSDVIAQFLKDKEIKHVFGIIGAGNAHIFDSINSLGYTEIVCVHHEQAAVMAMGTYYRTCGKISAALLTTGAGSTNAVTGVVSCWMDSIPGLLISGNEKSIYTTEENPLRIWGVQGYDSCKMVEGVTKYSARVMKSQNVRYELEKSYFITGDKRPGPVWLDIPMDIQGSYVDNSDLIAFENHKEIKQYSSLDSSVDEVIQKLNQAKRPLLWLGHGIRFANAENLLPQLLEATGAAALVTWQGIDMINSDHPQVFGRAGVYGQRHSNFILQNCDFLLTIGTRLAIPQVGYDLSEFVREASIASVDIDPVELEKFNDKIKLKICADANDFITALISKIGSKTIAKKGEWLNYCSQMKEKYPMPGPEHADANGFINSYKFMDKISKDMPEDIIVTTDMGTALLSGHQALKIRGQQRLMTSTGLGEMGFGLPAAVGASFGLNKGQVLCLNCDGGMMMNLQELQTITHHQLPIKIVVFNNDGYLMIKHTQKNLFKGRYSSTNKSSGVSCPNFTKVAAAFEMKSYTIRTWEDYEKVIPEFFNDKVPSICEVFMDPEQFFYPKLGLALKEDGSIVSPPLEDLSPFVSRKEMEENMIIGIHPKSKSIVP